MPQDSDISKALEEFVPALKSWRGECLECGKETIRFMGCEYCDECREKLIAFKIAQDTLERDEKRMRYIVSKSHFKRDLPTFKASQQRTGDNNPAWNASSTWNYSDNMIISGPVGTGKTHTAKCILSEALARFKTVGFITAQDYCNKAFDSDSYGFYDNFKNLDVVLIDDIDKVLWKEFNLSTFGELVAHRYEEELPTLFTTNLNPGNLLAYFSRHAPENASRAEAIYDRMSHGITLTFHGGSLRRMGKKTNDNKNLDT